MIYILEGERISSFQEISLNIGLSQTSRIAEVNKVPPEQIGQVFYVLPNIHVTTTNHVCITVSREMQDTSFWSSNKHVHCSIAKIS